MPTFTITSRAGSPMGVWIGETKAHALAAMHREAGHVCRVHDGRVIFERSDAEALCGQVEDWCFEQMPETPLSLAAEYLDGLLKDGLDPAIIASHLLHDSQGPDPDGVWHLEAPGRWTKDGHPLAFTVSATVTPPTILDHLGDAFSDRETISRSELRTWLAMLATNGDLELTDVCRAAAQHPVDAWTEAAAGITFISLFDGENGKPGSIRYDTPGGMHPMQHAAVCFVAADMPADSLDYLREKCDRLVLVT